MKLLIAAAASAALLAPPASAHASTTRQFERAWVGANGKVMISPARAAALRQCSAVAAQWLEHEWGNMEIYQYRACMNRHGQVE